MEWLVSREFMIALAILGALVSFSASLFKMRGGITEARVRQLDAAGYGLMGASMLLFIIIGFRS